MTSFRIMSWNVENLFRPGDEVSPGNTVPAARYEAKLEYLAGVIADVSPDVLALQELGGDAAAVRGSLADLAGYLRGDYPYTAISDYPDGRSIRVAFLARLPLEGRSDIVDFAPGELSAVADWAPKPPVTRLGRGALAVQVEPAPGVRIRLVTLHLKSKLITYPPKGGKTRFNPGDENERATGAGLALLRRTAEAATVRIALNDLMLADRDADRDRHTVGHTTVGHTVVLGDLNDDPEAATSQLLAGPGDRDVTAADKGDAVRLYNLMSALARRGGPANDRWFLPEGERFTRIYGGRGELIDHIYVSRGLLGDADLKAERWRLREVRSLVAGIRGEAVGDDAGARIGEVRPDHAPVYASFEL